MRNWMILFLLVSTIACDDQSNKESIDTSQFVAHTVENDFGIETPKYMKLTSNLNPDASLELENQQREVYLAIIEEKKEDVERNLKLAGVYNEDLPPVGNYFNVQKNGFIDRLELLEEGTAEKTTVNDMSAYQIEFIAKPEALDVGIYYLITFIEGEETLYMFMQWTLEDQKEQYQDLFFVIADTFEELP